MVISVNEEDKVDCVMAEAPHGTAPTLQGRNVANPMAMILAGAALFAHMNDKRAERVSRAIYEGTLEAIYDGHRTADLSGSTPTSDFVNEVIRRVKTKIEVWATLA
jgi:isocitrate dehydrogenase (NAD+)